MSPFTIFFVVAQLLLLCAGGYVAWPRLQELPELLSGLIGKKWNFLLRFLWLVPVVLILIALGATALWAYFLEVLNGLEGPGKGLVVIVIRVMTVSLLIRGVLKTIELRLKIRESD